MGRTAPGGRCLRLQRGPVLVTQCDVLFTSTLSLRAEEWEMHLAVLWQVLGCEGLQALSQLGACLGYCYAVEP